MKEKDTITFYASLFEERCHCVVCFSNKTFRTDIKDILYNRTTRRILRMGFSCFELANIEELKCLVRYLEKKGFKQEDYLKEEMND